MNVNLSTLLDVALSLIFVFFVFSLFVSGIVEFINGLVEKRAALFRRALDKVLGSALAADFFDETAVRIKQEKYWGFLRPISYLSGDSFSTALVAMLVKASGQHPQSTTETLMAIRQVITEPRFAQLREIVEPILLKTDTFQTFKNQLEIWYNGYMEQVSGWFKRYAQSVIWMVAAGITLLFNVDTVRITNRLYADRTLRSKLVAQAEQAAQRQLGQTRPDTAFLRYLSRRHAGLTRTDSVTRTPLLRTGLTSIDSLEVQGAYLEFSRDRIESLGLPIGWGQPLNGWSIPGFLLTMAALSFGAPFWFDLLVKIVNIRNAARRPPTSKP